MDEAKIVSLLDEWYRSPYADQPLEDIMTTWVKPEEAGPELVVPKTNCPTKKRKYVEISGGVEERAAKRRAV